MLTVLFDSLSRWQRRLTALAGALVVTAAAPAIILPAAIARDARLSKLADILLGGTAVDRERPAKMATFGTTSGQEAVPVQSLAVFRRARTRADSFSRALDPISAHLLPAQVPDVPSHEQPGTLDVEQSRLALSLGRLRRLRIFAIPTSNGWGCIVAAPPSAVGVHCVRAVSPTGVSVSARERSGKFLIFGFAGDDVQSINVNADNSSTAAALSDNVFFVTVSRGVRSPVTLEVHDMNGETKRIPIPLEAFNRGPGPL